MSCRYNFRGTNYSRAQLIRKLSGLRDRQRLASDDLTRESMQGRITERRASELLRMPNRYGVATRFLDGSATSQDVIDAARVAGQSIDLDAADDIIIEYDDIIRQKSYEDLRSKLPENKIGDYDLAAAEAMRRGIAVGDFAAMLGVSYNNDQVISDYTSTLRNTPASYLSSSNDVIDDVVPDYVYSSEDIKDMFGIDNGTIDSVLGDNQIGVVFASSYDSKSGYDSRRHALVIPPVNYDSRDQAKALVNNQIAQHSAVTSLLRTNREASREMQTLYIDFINEFVADIKNVLGDQLNKKDKLTNQVRLEDRVNLLASRVVPIDRIANMIKEDYGIELDISKYQTSPLMAIGNDIFKYREEIIVKNLERLGLAESVSVPWRSVYERAKMIPELANSQAFAMLDKISSILDELDASVRIIDREESISYSFNGEVRYGLPLAALNFYTMTPFQVATHELLHVATIAKMINSEDPKVKRIKNELLEVLDVLRNDPDFDGEYGLTNIFELIAELSDPQFVNKLKNKKIKERSILQIIGNLIDWLLGLSNMSYYDFVTDRLDEILKVDVRSGFADLLSKINTNQPDIGIDYSRGLDIAIAKVSAKFNIPSDAMFMRRFIQDEEFAQSLRSITVDDTRIYDAAMSMIPASVSPLVEETRSMLSRVSRNLSIANYVDQYRQGITATDPVTEKRIKELSKKMKSSNLMDELVALNEQELYALLNCM